VIGGAAAAGGCATEEEKQVAARVAALQESARSWFEGNDGKLCPLAQAEAWVAPFSSISLEPAGSPDQHKAIMPFWCTGTAGEESRRLSGVATIPPGGAWTLDYDGATISSVAEVGFGEVLLYWAGLPMGVVLGLVLLSRVFPIHMILGSWPGADVSAFFAYPPVGIVAIGILTILGSCYWTNAVLHSSWTYALTPLQIVPSFSLLTRAYLRGLQQ
jgi:hypothetical protein